MPANEKTTEVEKKPKKKLISVKTFYDKEDGTFFGRTCKDWALLFVFFLFFYICLFGYFTLLIYIFIAGIMTPGVPFRTGFNSLIGTQPAMAFRPLLDTQSSIMVISANMNSSTARNYINLTNNYLNTIIPAPAPIGKPCSNESFIDPDKDNVCMFNRSLLGPCANVTSELMAQRFCVFLRINNIYGWMPSVRNPNVSNDILVSCVGQTPNDVPNIGPVAYYPSRNFSNGIFGVFPNYYFPFLNQATYWSPLVAVEFMNLTKNIVVYVNCTIINVDNIAQSTTMVIVMTGT